MEVARVKKTSRGTVCCVPGCNNNTKFSRGISWHGFPKEPRTRKEWIRRVHRVGNSGKYSKWSPTTHHKICGAHFNESGKKKYEEKLPWIFPHRTYTTKFFDVQTTRVATIDDSFNPIIYPMQYDETSFRFVSELATDLDVGANVVVNHVPTNYATKPYPSTLTKSQTTTNAAPTVGSELICVAPDSSLHLTCHNYALPQTETLSSVRKTLDDVITANSVLQERNLNLTTEVKQLRDQLSNLKNKCINLETQLTILKAKPQQRKGFDIESLLNDDSKIRFYTGFENRIRLDIFLEFIVTAYDSTKKKGKYVGRPRVLEIKNEVFLVLCRLRLGLLEVDLAHRFQVSVTTINRAWNFWIPFICSCLVQVPTWPSRQIVDRYMPQEFKDMYPTTRVILVSTELFIEKAGACRVPRPSSKSRKKAKGMIGMTPNGLVSLVADLAPGTVSDTDMANGSGLYSKLQPGDSVMADSGFLIKDSLRKIGVGLNTFPVVKGRPRLRSEDTQPQRDLAKLRINVERVVRNVKQFRILKYVFHHATSDKLDQIWKICCLLNNFTNEPLLDR